MYNFYMFYDALSKIFVVSAIIITVVLFILIKRSLSKGIKRVNKNIINVKILDKEYVPFHTDSTFAMVNFPIYPIIISTMEQYRIYFYENKKKYVINSFDTYSTKNKGETITLEKYVFYILEIPVKTTFKII